ncbi:MAG: hypothetical protein M3290_04910, partial [Actinomycetota bacterium]|nr:hypothetical protein [Actinomycetota bacterium]
MHLFVLAAADGVGELGAREPGVGEPRRKPSRATTSTFIKDPSMSGETGEKERPYPFRKGTALFTSNAYISRQKYEEGRHE